MMTKKIIETANRKQAALKQKADKLRQQLQSVRGEIRQQKRVISDIAKRTRLPRLAELGTMFEREGLDHIDPIILYGALAEKIKMVKKELAEPGKAELYLEEGRQRIAPPS
ncbi:MAG: hypothetical protein ACTSV1_05220 [Alphaproteobacteria bacterium]